MNFVPGANSLRQHLCILAHQGEAGHRGIDNTLHLLRERFVWMGLDADVGTFVRQCLHCLKVRGGRTVPRPWGDTLHANGSHQILHFDFMFIRAADPSTEHGYEYLLVIMDGFSRFVELVRSATADARAVVDAFMKRFARSSFGRVHMFVSDQGSHFHNVVVKSLRDALATITSRRCTHRGAMAEWSESTARFLRCSRCCVWRGACQRTSGRLCFL